MTIKGPSGRQKHVVDRRWECPICGKQESTGGDVTARRCPMCPDDLLKPTWMRLIEERPAPRKTAPALAQDATS